MNRHHAFLLLMLSLFALSCKETTTIYESNTLTDPAIMPEVIYTSPGANTTGPYDGFTTSFTVRFNKLMDPSSVRHAVHFLSSVGDILPDTCGFAINQGDVATIVPVRSVLTLPFLWRVGRQYTLRIDSTAKDIFGNHLTEGWTMTFMPEPAFRVKSISPLPGAVNVNTTSVQISFNAPVDSALRSRITFTPPLPGLWRYVRYTSAEYDSSQIGFQSNSAFPPGMTFSVTIPATVSDKNGDPLTAGFSSSFSTTGFTVTSTNPGDGGTGWPISGLQLTIGFNDSLDDSTVPGAFSIDPAIAGTIEYSPNPRTFYFVASDNYLLNTVYTVKIDTSVRSLAHARMPRPYVFSFLTAPTGSGSSNPSVSYTTPRNGDTLVPMQSPIYIVFNSALDTASARAAFSITPPVTGLLSVQNYGEIYFSPIDAFVQSTLYTVTIGSSLRSSQGVALAAPYVFTFRTEPFNVTQTNPSDGTTHVPTSISSITVTTNGFIDPATVSAAWSISPNTPGTLTLAQNGRVLVFQPSSPLLPLTPYFVTISTALHSTSGIALPADHSFAFATGN